MIWTSLIAQGKRQMWMSLLVATLMAVVFYHFARFYQGTASSLLFAIGWVPLAAFWIRAAGRLISHLKRHPFDRLDLGLARDQVAPGQSFEIEIQGRARRDLVLNGLRAELRCERRKSSDRARRSELLFTHSHVEEDAVSWGAGTNRTMRIELPVEAGAPFSFRSMEGRISWSIHVTLDIEDWGEMKDELGVTVAPG